MTKIFISYKRDPDGDLKQFNRNEAKRLYEFLKPKNYDVFWDQELEVGSKWDQSIYDHILTSDFLVLLVTEDVISPWVQREVDCAIANKVTIIPMRFIADNAKFSEILSKLEIDKLHALSDIDTDARYKKLIETIKSQKYVTREQQQLLMKKRQDKWKEEDRKDEYLKPFDFATRDYKKYGYKGCSLWISTGSITEIKGVDALVNSENVYMQMQRVFEKESVSKQIRLEGAVLEGENTIKEDTIQDELNRIVFNTGLKQLPVDRGSVIVTSAGHPQSKLSKKGIRYIFHVAVVTANTDGELPIKEEKADEIIKNCVLNSLEGLENMNSMLEESLTSIIFPVLGTGNAGVPYEKSATMILKSFKYYIDQHPQTKLKNIYLIGYTQRDIDRLLKIYNDDSDLKKHS